MAKENSLIVSLDVGTYKTAVVVAEAAPEGIEVLGVGTALSQGGLRKGQVINVDATVQAIRPATVSRRGQCPCTAHIQPTTRMV